MRSIHLILYTADQQASAAFYRQTLDLVPRLDTPGMTEFELPGGAILGLMPEKGIKALLGDGLPDPADAAGIPRAELYVVVDDVDLYHRRALSAGARELSPNQRRDWGHDTSYSLDLDGHVLAFARISDST